MITVTNLSTMMDPKTNEVIGVPMFGGKFTFCTLSDVDGDEVGEDGHRSLIYNEDGTLARNYVMCFFDANEVPTMIPNAAALVKFCGFTDADVSIMDNWISEMNGVGTGIPIIVDKVPINGIDTYVFGNLADYYKEMRKEELKGMYDEYLAQLGPNNEAGYSFDAYSATVDTSYDRLLSAYPDMEEWIKSHMYIRSVLAKLAAVIQKRYNMLNFEEPAITVANIISKIRYFDDNGNIVPLTITAMDNFFSRIKDNVRIGDPTKTGIDIHDGYKRS